MGMRKLLLIAGTAALAIGVFATAAVATHNYSGNAEGDPMEIANGGPGGNYFCPSNTIVGPKIDPGANYSDAYINVTGYDGKTFDWAFTALGNQTYDMAVVIVKGGPISAVYTYDYTASPAFDDSDENLAAPTNPANGKDYGISHIQFCYDPKGGGGDD